MPLRLLKHTLLAFVWLLWLPLAGHAQSEQSEEEFTREFVYGINFNTSGGLLGGGMLKWSRSYKENISRFFQVEIVEVKHPKEFRYVNEITQQIFVLGKSNYLYVVRPQVGMERLLFRKAPDQGVQISALAGGGLAIGILKPYYIYYDYTPSGRPSQQDVRTEQYDPQIHGQVDRILGNPGFASNFGKSKIRPGLNARAGLTFEHGQYRERVAGIEVGVQFEQYFEKIILVPQSQNNSSFTSVYFTLYYGHRR